MKKLHADFGVEPFFSLRVVPDDVKIGTNIIKVIIVGSRVTSALSSFEAFLAHLVSFSFHADSTCRTWLAREELLRHARDERCEFYFRCGDMATAK